MWSTNTHFCLQVFQKLFKFAVNSESIKITSHPEVFSRPASETRNQSRNKEAMITWFRASFEHEDIKLIVIKEFRVSIPRWHCRGIVRWLGIPPRRIQPVVPALVPALTSPLIIPIPSRIVKLLLWFCCFSCPPSSFLCVLVERNLCCLKS